MLSTHKLSVMTCQQSRPLNPPNFGDFELRPPPRIGGTKGGKRSILREQSRCVYLVRPEGEEL